MLFHIIFVEMVIMRVSSHTVGGCTFFFVALPLLLTNLLLLSMEAALRRGDFPFFPPSGFSIHQELFPVPSFWMRTKRLCKDRLCLMEFCAGKSGSVSNKREF